MHTTINNFMRIKKNFNLKKIKNNSNLKLNFSFQKL